MVVTDANLGTIRTGKAKWAKKSKPGFWGVNAASPGRRCLSGLPLGVGGELLSHGLPQYHRRGGA